MTISLFLFLLSFSEVALLVAGMFFGGERMLVRLIHGLENVLVLRFTTEHLRWKLWLVLLHKSTTRKQYHSNSGILNTHEAILWFFRSVFIISHFLLHHIFADWLFVLDKCEALGRCHVEVGILNRCFI